jgi:transposase
LTTVKAHRHASGAARACDAVLVVPSRRNRKHPRSLYKPVYRRRNIVERVIGRLKDHRRLAICYDKTDQNYKALLCIRAAIFNLNPTLNTT